MRIQPIAYIHAGIPDYRQTKCRVNIHDIPYVCSMHLCKVF